MKLSIDDLMVDSYAIQFCEQELTDIKGGSTPLYVLGGVVVTAVAAVWSSYNSQPKSNTVITNKLKNRQGGDSLVVSTIYH